MFGCKSKKVKGAQMSFFDMILEMTWFTLHSLSSKPFSDSICEENNKLLLAQNEGAVCHFELILIPHLLIPGMFCSSTNIC